MKIVRAFLIASIFLFLGVLLNSHLGQHVYILAVHPEPPSPPIVFNFKDVSFDGRVAGEWMMEICKGDGKCVPVMPDSDKPREEK